MSKKNMNINIGSKIYFKKDGVSNYDLYWTVKSINGTILEIEIDEMGYNETIHIDKQDVTNVSPVWKQLIKIIDYYLPLIKVLEDATGKQILKSLKKKNDKINFISNISEIKFGGILLNEFENFLKYEPKVCKKKPDWLVEIKNEKIIFEVLKINLSNEKMDKKITDFENEIGFAPSGLMIGKGIFNDYGKIIEKEKKYRELIENHSHKLIICIDASEFDKYIDNRDVEIFFDFKNNKSKIYEYPKFIDNVSGIISLSYWVNDYKFIENENVKNRISKPILKQIKKTTLKGLKI